MSMIDFCQFCATGWCSIHGLGKVFTPSVPLFAPLPAAWPGTVTITELPSPRTADFLIKRLDEIRKERAALLAELAALVEKAGEP